MKISNDIDKAPQQQIISYKKEFGNLFDLNHPGLTADDLSNIRNLMDKPLSTGESFESSNQNDSPFKKRQIFLAPDFTNSKEEFDLLSDLLDMYPNNENTIPEKLVNNDQDMKGNLLKGFESEENLEESMKLNQFDLLISEKTFERAFKVELKTFNEPFIIQSRNNEINISITQSKQFECNKNIMEESKDNLNYGFVTRIINSLQESQKLNEFLTNFESLGPVKKSPKNVKGFDSFSGFTQTQTTPISNEPFIKVETYESNERDDSMSNHSFEQQTIQQGGNETQSSKNLNLESQNLDRNEISFNKDLAEKIFDPTMNSTSQPTLEVSKAIQNENEDLSILDFPKKNMLNFSNMHFQKKATQNISSINENLFVKNPTDSIKKENSVQEKHNNSKNFSSNQFMDEEPKCKNEMEISSQVRLEHIDQNFKKPPATSQKIINDGLSKYPKSHESHGEFTDQNASSNLKIEKFKSLTKPILNKEFEIDNSETKESKIPNSTKEKLDMIPLNDSIHKLSPEQIMMDEHSKKNPMTLQSMLMAYTQANNIKSNSMNSSDILSFFGLVIEEINKITTENKEMKKEIVQFHGQIEYLLEQRRSENQVMVTLQQNLDATMCLLKKRDEDFKQLHTQHTQLVELFKQHVSSNCQLTSQTSNRNSKNCNSPNKEDSFLKSSISEVTTSSPHSIRQASFMDSSTQRNESKLADLPSSNCKFQMKSNENLQNQVLCDQKNISVNFPKAEIKPNENQQIFGSNFKNPKFSVKSQPQANLISIEEEKQETQKINQNNDFNNTGLNNSYTYSRSKSQKKNDNQKENKVKASEILQQNKQPESKIGNLLTNKEEEIGLTNSIMVKGSIDSLAEYKQGNNDRSKNFKKYADILKRQKEMIEQSEKMLQGELRTRLLKKK